MRFTLVNTGRLAALIAGAAVSATLATAPAHADVVGSLSCQISAGTGIIVVSQRAVSCVYQSNNGVAERYTGSISRLGVDIGTLDSGTLTYEVAGIGTPSAGGLAGNYIGAGFGVTLGSGGGLNALVGGNGNQISLQPISVTTSTGTNVNAGIGNLNLNYAGPARPALRRHHRRMHHRHHRG